MHSLVFFSHSSDTYVTSSPSGFFPPFLSVWLIDLLIYWFIVLYLSLCFQTTSVSLHSDDLTVVTCVSLTALFMYKNLTFWSNLLDCHSCFESCCCVLCVVDLLTLHCLLNLLLLVVLQLNCLHHLRVDSACWHVSPATKKLLWHWQPIKS